MANSETAKTYHHGNLRNTIVAAAGKHIEKTGEWNFSLRGIAAAIGVSHNAPYMHFADKRALLAAVGAQGFNLLSEKLIDAFQDKSVLGFVAVGRAYIDFGRASPGLYRLMFDPSFASDAPEEIDAAGKRAFGLLVDALLGIFAESGFSDDEVVEKAFAAWSLVHGLTSLIIDQRGLAQSLDSAASLPLFVDDALQNILM